MNILYLSNKKRWGGIVSWMEKTANGLEKLGHNVWIFSHPDSLFTQKASSDLNITPFKMGNEHNPFALLKIISFIKKNKIELILSNVKKESVIASKAAKICKIPHVRRIGTEKDLNHPHALKLYKKRKIDATISPCQFMNEIILQKFNFLNEDEFFHVYNGRDSKTISQNNKTNIKKKYGIPSDKIIIGSLCQLSKSKNVTGIINVFNEILKSNSNIHLVIAGEGPEKENIIRIISNLGIKENCSILGFVKESQEISSVFDIGVLFSTMEGFSNSVVEFMSVGTPVICSDVGGQKEIIENSNNGFLVEAGNENQLNEKLLELLKNKEKREIMSNNARKTVEAKFSEKQMITKLEKLFLNTINEYKGAK